MKRLLFLGLISLFLVSAEAQESYVMYETMYMKPKTNMAESFNTAMTAHNKKFHAKGESGVRIFYVVNGPFEGQYVWVMGPLTYTGLDSRPTDKAHDDDWNKVMLSMDEVSLVEYWKQSKDQTYNPAGSEKYQKRLIRVFDIKDGHGKEFEELLGKSMAVVKKQGLPYSMNVYWNEFETNTGRDCAVVYGFDKYAIFDKDMGFVKAFEEMHGENSWTNHFQRMKDNTNSMIEELRELVPELGGVSQ